MRDIGFIDMTKRGDLSQCFIFLGPLSRRLTKSRKPILLDARYFLVKNFINNTSFFDWDEGTCNSYFNKIPHAVDIVVPKLSERACEKVEVSAVPFATFIVDKTANGQAAGHSFALKGYVRHRLKAYSPNATALGLQKFRMHKMLSGVIRQGRGAVSSARQFLRARSQPLPTLRACGGRDGE